ncbi:ThiJ/PfpI [Tricharina praecox]|uniref:ThiJ/PfpI n=1 Tax=Tricharina praecox TaxID=43433 RepID=UPI00221E65EB|nr:ThiJ/PfpI [Tricharina praecox]KAI5858997.1 ThiJ/PfpI [Tricharina praecox]
MSPTLHSLSISLILLLSSLIMSACASPRNISIGVLYLDHYQYLDAAGPIDIIGMSSTAYAGRFAPEAIKALAPEIIWHHVSATYPKPMQASSGPPSLPSTNLSSCPKLDYLLIPGPSPTLILTEEEKEFIIRKSEEVEAVMTICTAGLILSQTGLLEGKKACTNKVSLAARAAAGTVPKGVHWVSDRRWAVDGKFWSSAGITAGMDLAVQWVRRVVGEEMLQWVKEVAEYDPIEAGGDRFSYLLTGAEL